MTFLKQKRRKKIAKFFLPLLRFLLKKFKITLVRYLYQSFLMVDYSQQVKDKISSILTNDRIKVVDVSVENAVLEILLNKRETPRGWKRTGFSPANVYKDAFEVLGYVNAGKTWQVHFHEDTQLFEVYVVDKKYSVVASSLARAIMLALWNYNQLHDVQEDVKALTEN